MARSFRRAGVSRLRPHPRITRVNVEYARQGMGESPLVLTKIEPPRLRPGHIARGELVERLRHGLHRRLNLVAAPAGWGKTSLLAEWLSVEDEVAFAWLSLRDRDGAELAEDLEFDRHLVDYLGDEVLAAQDADVRRFLLDTCVLDR